MTWVNDVRRANEALDWIEARQGPLPADGYARIETTAGRVRAMAEGQDDDARLAQIRARVEAATPGPWGYNSYSGVFGPPDLCAADDGPDYPESPRPTPGSPEDRVWVAQSYAAYEADPRVCKVPALYGDMAIGRHAADAEFIAHAREDVPRLLARLDALTAEASDVARENEALIDEVKAAGEQITALAAERDTLRARAERAEAALFPCTLALEYRDGVTCREERDKGVCLNHRVIAGLRVHAVTADRLEIENRALRRQVRASYGIIHEGLHGGKPTDPDHQEACEMPSCRNARAVLAGSREQSAGDGA